MTGECFLDAHGAPIHICGYAAVFDLPSWPMGRNDGCCEIIKPWAFDHVLRHPRAGLNLQFHHGGLEFIAGSLALDTLQIWTDDFGLGFQAGPFNICGRNVALLNSITSGEVRWASWSGWLASARFEIVGGERVKVIRRFKTLDHISPVNEPAYPDTGIWLSSEHRDDLPPRLCALAEIWAAHRPTYDTLGALRKMSRAVSRLPRRAPASRLTPSSPQARASAKRRVSVPLAMHEVFIDGCGFSGAELAKLALQERKAWRMFRSKYPGILPTKARCA
jgi:phage head maturation protease